MTRTQPILFFWTVAALLLGLGTTNAAPTGDLPVEGPVLKVTVEKTKFLPPAMYGTWNVRATVVQSNAPPWLYAPASNELWTLQRSQNRVTLTNILTSATADVHVDAVEGNTATFHHVAKDDRGKLQITEYPTVTVEGDRLYGINRQDLRFYRKGQLLATYHLDIQIEGSRLSGAQVTFDDPNTANPFLEVAPLQYAEP